MATRREAVLLELEDHFTSGIARAAVATKAFERSLNDLDGTSTKASKSTKVVGDEAETTGRKVSTGGREIDRFSGRVRVLGEVAATLGPALIPIGAAAVPAIVGLGAAFGAAAAGAGVALVAFNGVGDALKALDTYQVQPTAANLQKLHIEMDKLGPAGAEFVHFLDSLEPQLQQIQNIARSGLLPGVEDGLSNLLRLMPQARQIVFSLSTAMGDLATSAGDALAGERFAGFFRYLETDAAPTLTAFGHAIGNIVEGFANLAVAFAPLTRDFTGGFESMTRAFADWADGLSRTQGFQDFVSYVRESGPQVIDLLGALATALVGIVRAAAPLGQVVLPTLTALAKIVGALANSPLGTPFFTGLAGVLAFNRAADLLDSTLRRVKSSTDAAGASASSAGSRLSTVATGIGAVVLAAQTLGSAIDKRSYQGLDQYALAVKNLADGAAGAQKSIDSLFTATTGNTTFDKVLGFGFGGGISDVTGTVTSLRGAIASLPTGKLESLQQSAYGAFRDTSADVAAKQIQQYDAALAALADGGHLDAAQKGAAYFAQQAAAAGRSSADAAALLPQYSDALARNQVASDNATAANQSYAAAVAATGNAAGLTRSQMNGLSEAMKEQRQTALAAFDAETAYRQALKDAGKQAASNTAGIRGNSKEALDNRQALSQLAGAWNNQSDAVRNNVSRYRQAKAAFIETATQMGVNAQRAEELARRYLAIPNKILTDIKLAGGQEAYDEIQRIKAELASIPRSLRTTYYVTQVNAANVRNAGGRDGDPSTPYAAGGTVAGSRAPYGDKVPALLAPGEEVISNRYGQADRYRALLKAINANRYANGGTVGGARVAAPMMLGNITIKGTLNTPFGPAEVEGIATQVARSEIDADKRFTRVRSGG